MANKRYTAEEILGKLRQAEVLIGQGRTVAEACCELGVTEVTSFRWRKEHAGLKLDQARLLKELEKENARLSLASHRSGGAVLSFSVAYVAALVAAGDGAARAEAMGAGS